MTSQATPCRRCSECKGAEHHWLDNSDFGNHDDPERNPFAEFVCKHCPAEGRECPTCQGEDGCDDCGYHGIVTMDRAAQIAANYETKQAEWSDLLESEFEVGDA